MKTVAGAVARRYEVMVQAAATLGLRQGEAFGLAVDFVWKPTLIKADIPTTHENGFHMLRHHFASVLLERGVSIKAVADFLGHADPGFTLRTYTHLMPSSEDRMRQVIEDVWATGQSALDVP
ncbi:tyrosine-type recombinase/integrase [Streptosporangium sp. NPDC005286]|uniref:tyrosine-type recombinase/integrase n=1 Tax=Streptosporangium sp. NPDC005286 TaxID=3154463 RepID=UPI0033BF8E06